MRLILIEPQLSIGHHPIYVRLISEEGLRRGWHIRLLTAQTEKDFSLTGAHQAGGDFSVHPIMQSIVWPATGGLWARLQYQWRMLLEMRKGVAELVKSEPADFVYVTNFDYFFRVAWLLGSPFDVPFAGFLANITFHLAASGVLVPPSRRVPIDAWMFRRLLGFKALKALLTTDETLPAHETSHGIEHSSKIKHIPELVTIRELRDRDTSRAALGLAADSFAILCYGSLSARKGVAELLAALQLPECPKNVVGLLVGRQDADVRAYVGQEGAERLRHEGRLIEINRFVTLDEEVEAFSAADVAWLGYVGYFGISGVTIQAGVSGLPSIACKEGIIGHWVKNYDIGLTVDVRDPVAVVEAIRALQEDVALRERLKSNGAAVRKLHTPSGFAEGICDAIEGSVAGALSPPGLKKLA